MLLKSELRPFLGKCDLYSSEFLPIGKEVWKNGPRIPATLIPDLESTQPLKLKSQITRNFQQRWCSLRNYFTGHKLSKIDLINYFTGHKLSRNEFIIIKVDQIFKFDIRTKEWSVLHKLIIPRIGFSTFIFKGKLFITGGYSVHGYFQKVLQLVTYCTEVVDLSTMKSLPFGNLNTARFYHGMSIMKINDELRLVVLGGQTKMKKHEKGLLDSIEVWNEDTQSWDNTEFKLPHKNSRFATTTYFL